jgi:hypothetical protein
MSQEVVARFEAFIQKITSRYQEVLAEADAGFADLIASDPTDTITYGNAMNGIHARVLGLGKMLQDTYQNQVSPQMTPQEDSAGRDRLDAVQRWLDDDWERRKANYETNIYRALWPLAQAAMQKGGPCNSCGRELKLKNPIMVEAITCPGCHTVNQVAPDPVVSTYFGGAPHAFAIAATLSKREAINAQRKRAHEWRRARDWADESIEFLREWEALERDYWTTYYATHSSISPLSDKDRTEYIESRMRPFYEALERNEVEWRKYKGLPTR